MIFSLNQRWRVFIISSVLFCLAGWAVNYSRPPVYRSQAVLEGVSVPIEQRLTLPANANQALLQQQVLLSQPVLTEAVARLQARFPKTVWTVAELKARLNVEPMPDSHVLQVIAEGDNPEQLSVMVNTVLDSYLALRADSELIDQAATAKSLAAEAEELAERIKRQRQALEDYRRHYDIVSVERQENAALAQLNAQSAALNHAREAMIAARAEVEAIEQAIAQGKPVLPDREQSELKLLQRRLQELQTQLAEFDRRYTRKYLAMKPELRFIPEEIQRLEKQIQRKLADGKRIVLAEAERNLEAAEHTFSILQADYDKQQRRAAEFSSRFARYQALEQDLAGMEKRYRETRERLSQLQLSQIKPLPPARIIDRALASSDPVRPNYTRDALLTIPVAIVLGLLSVGLMDFLSIKEKIQPPIGTPVFTARDVIEGHTAPVLSRASAPVLSPPPPLLELTEFEIIELLSATHALGRQVCALLLSGVRLTDLPLLEPEWLDVADKRLRLPEPWPRTLNLSPLFPVVFADDELFPPWPKEGVLTELDFENMVAMSALAARLPKFERVTAACLEHSLVMVLLRQGFKLATLQQRLGVLEPSLLAYYHQQGQPQSPRDLPAEAPMIHPALARFIKELKAGAGS